MQVYTNAQIYFQQSQCYHATGNKPAHKRGRSLNITRIALSDKNIISEAAGMKVKLCLHAATWQKKCYILQQRARPEPHLSVSF